jgi:fatty acid desaturase
MLRHKADRRTVAYLVVAAALLPINWSMESPNVALVVLACFLGVSVSVIAHNHNHTNIWRSRPLNRLTDYWITLFYGFPTFAWIPTHNMNHHKRNNREGDYTATWRFSENNNLLTLLTYPTLSGMAQQPPTVEFLRETKRKNSKRYWWFISQYVVLGVFLGVLFWLDWKKALLYAVLPQQVALFTVLVFNYVQHIHADEESPINHSRNFVGWGLNAFLFNNGYHTVHHDNPGLHWSQLPEAHAAIAHKLEPCLNEPSFFWFMVRVYLLGPFVPSFRTRSLRAERLARSPQPTGL